MAWKIYNIGKVRIIEIDDYKLDNQNSEITGNMLGNEIDNNYDNIVIDLKNVDFISSLGIATLIAAHEEMKKKGLKLFLSSLTKNVEELFTLSGASDIFRVFKSTKGVLEFINKNG